MRKTPRRFHGGAFCVRTDKGVVFKGDMAMKGLIFALLVALAAGGCAGKAVARKGAAAEGVSFSVSPSDAEVLIDNVLQGKAADFRDDHPLVLPVGPHILELRAPGHASYSRQLAVSWGPKKVEATLRRKDESQP